MTEKTRASGKTKRSRISVSSSVVESRYSLELARGASIIASSLGETSLTQAVNETLPDFLENHGSGELEPFIRLLGERLEQRGRADAVRRLGVWAPDQSTP